MKSKSVQWNSSLTVNQIKEMIYNSSSIVFKILKEYVWVMKVSARYIPHIRMMNKIKSDCKFLKKLLKVYEKMF